MTVTLIPREYVNSDAGIAKIGNSNHASAIFEFTWNNAQALAFYHNSISKEFDIEVHWGEINLKYSYLMRGSLFSWIKLINKECLQSMTKEYMLEVLSKIYPISVKALLNVEEIQYTFPFMCNCIHISEEYLLLHNSPHNKWKILSATFYIEAPISVVNKLFTNELEFTYTSNLIKDEIRFWMTASLDKWAQFIKLFKGDREINKQIKMLLVNTYPSWASEYNF